MIVGCYYTQAYCDGLVEGDNTSEDYMRHQFPEQYGPVSDGGAHQAHSADASAQTMTETYKDLRARGWKIDAKNGKAFCPGCVELGRHK